MNHSNAADATDKKSLFKKCKLTLIIPILIFGVIVAFFWRGLSLDPRHLPSVLIDKPFPEFSLSRTSDYNAIVTKQDLLGKPALVHIWATWCEVCAYEHNVLISIAKHSPFPIYGITYKDERHAAARWLKEGNPYTIDIHDADGKLGLNLGIYGTPEMFVIDGKGVIRHRQVGPIDAEEFATKLLPLLRQLAQETQTPRSFG